MNRPRADQVIALAKQGVRWTFVLLAVRYVLNAASTAVLSHILLPFEFGLVGLAMTLSTFCQLFSDFGLGWATIQRTNISREQISNLFWINTMAGLVLWAICIVAGPVLNWFYGRTELIPISAAAGSTLFLGGIAAQPSALLRRQMRLRTLAFIQLAAVGAGVAIAIPMARLGYGYWALIAQTVGAQLVTLILVFPLSGLQVLRPCPGAGTRSFMQFGGYLTIFSILNYVVKTLDNIIVGKIGGPVEMAFYSRAYFLMTLPMVLIGSSLDAAIVPTLSALKDSPEALERAYRKSTTGVAYVSFPLSITVALTAEQTIPLLYGNDWLGVIPILVYLSVGGLFFSVHCFIALYIVSGKLRELALWSLFPLITMTTAFLIGARWGTVGVAVSYAIVMSLFVTPAGFYFAHRCSGVALAPTLRDLLRPFLTSLVIAACLQGVALLMPPARFGNWPVLTVKLVTALLVFGVLCGRPARNLLIGERQGR